MKKESLIFGIIAGIILGFILALLQLLFGEITMLTCFVILFFIGIIVPAIIDIIIYFKKATNES